MCFTFNLKISSQGRQIPDGQALQQCDDIFVTNYIYDTINQIPINRTYNCQRSAPAPGAPNAFYTYAFACHGNGEILNLTSSIFTTSTHQNYSYKWVIKTFELADTGWVYTPFMEIIQPLGTGKDTSINVDANIPTMYQGNYSVYLEQYTDNTLSTVIFRTCPLDFFIQGNARPINISVIKRGCQTCVELRGTFSPINKCTNSWTGANQKVYLDWGDNTLLDYVWGNARQNGGGADNPNPKRFCRALSPGTYNIKLTEQVNGDNCEIERKDSALFTVYPDPIYSITSPTTSYCSNNTTPFVLTANIQSQNPNSVFIYQWSTGATTASINVTPTSSTTYYVNMFDQDTTCIWTDSIKINVFQDCCFGSTFNGKELTFNDDKLSELIANPATAGLFTLNNGFYQFTFPSTNQIAFNGTFTVDRNFRFLNNIVRLNKNANINVTPGYDLKIEGGEIGPCGDMWGSISIDGTPSNGLKSKFITGLSGTNRPKIWGGQYAVTATNDAILDIQNADFENNWNALFLNNFVANQPQVNNKQNNFYEKEIL